MLTGTWTPLTHLAPAGIGTMELLTDGTVMASASVGPSSTAWYRLTPDASGSYVNGTWSQLPSMSISRLFFASNVLPDGRVLVLGGKYINDIVNSPLNNTGEIYDPVSNTWTSIANYPEVSFGTAPTTLTADGKVLAAWDNGPQTFIYDPASNSWSPGPTKLNNDPSRRETWIKLPGGGILTYDFRSSPDDSMTLDPTTNSWIDSGGPSVELSNPADGGLGPALLLPDGRVFFIGKDNGNTALYTPPTTPDGTGTWAAGPVIAGGDGFGAAAMLPNGHVLFSGGIGTVYSSPPTNHMVEYDPTAPLASAITDVTPPVDISAEPSYFQRMLMLPTGQVLWTNEYQQLYVYTPDGAPQAAWQPTIANVVANGSHYTLTGTQLNGLSAGTSYNGDGGAEMETNYPIVELSATDGSGHVYFARTTNWSGTGVATGSTPESTDFTLPAGLPLGTYSLTVVANGIASAPVSFTGGYTNEADLAVTNTGPATNSEGSNATYNLSVTNNGPTAATNVVLTDTLDPNLKYVSATKSQGSFTHSGSTVTFSFGTLAVGQTVTATVTAQALEDGNVTNAASVTSSLSDANLNNNSAVAITAVAEAPIVVSAPITVNGKNQNNVTVATFTHANGIEPASAFVATIAWGDNSTSTGTITLSGTTYTVKGSHTYASGGSHTVSTTVVEPAGMGNAAMVAQSSGGGSSSTATTATATASTSGGGSAPSSSASSPSAARDALFASAAGFGTSNVPSTNKPDFVGADAVPDSDSLDTLFEGLGTDIRSTGKSRGS